MNGELIIAIVNKGNVDAVMEGAKKAGARGGTFFGAHGTANKEIRSFFNIQSLPEKEIVLIITDHEIKDKVMLAIYESADIQTQGAGIVFCLPIENVLGITPAGESNNSKKK